MAAATTVPNTTTPHPQSAIRVTLLIRKLPSLTHEEFVSYWQNVHAPIFLSIPIVKEKCLKFQLFQPSPSLATSLQLPAGLMSTYDGEVNVWLRNLEDVAALLSDPEYLAKVPADAAKFSIPEEGRFLVGHDVDFVI